MYNEELARRLVEAVSDEADVTTRKMFGGFAVMLGGNMIGGVIGDDLMVRVGPNRYPDLITLPGARPMDMTGKASKSTLLVAGEVVADDDEFRGWVQAGREFVATLAPKR